MANHVDLTHYYTLVLNWIHKVLRQILQYYLPVRNIFPFALHKVKDVLLINYFNSQVNTR